jgi:MOSC domain-containing protein YiiM
VGTTNGRISALSLSSQRGTAKANVPEAELRADFGLVGDAHAGPGARQVSLLAIESIRALCSPVRVVAPGGMGENITLEGVDLSILRVGSRLRIGMDAELEVTQRGKRCHGRCAIFQQVGDCIMPREGVFARVLRSGRVRVGDTVEVIHDQGGRADGQ